MSTEVKYALRSSSGWASMTAGEKAVYVDHYTSVAAWEASQNYDITLATGDDTKQILEAFPDEDWVPTYPTVNWSGGKQDRSTDNILLIRAAPGHEFNFVTKTGVKLVNGVSDTTHGMVIRAGHVLDINGFGINFNCSAGIYFYARTSRLINCNIYNTLNGNFNTGNEAHFCLFEPSYAAGSTPGGGGTPYAGQLKNSTIIQKSGLGSYGGEIAVHSCDCLNVAVYNEGTNLTYSSFQTCTGDYNAQNNNGSAVPPGANSIVGLLTSDFNNYATGDYHITGTSALGGTGNNLIVAGTLSDPQYDVDGDLLPSTGAWDIGLDYYVAVSGGVTVEVPEHNISITSYAPDVSVSGGIIAEPLKHDINVLSYAPDVLVTNNITTTIPAHNISITSYAPEVTTGNNVIIDIPSHDIGLTSHTPIVVIGNNVVAEPAAHNIQISSYEPIATASNNIIVEVGAHDIKLVSYAPAVLIGDEIQVTIPPRNINLASYPPVVSAIANVSVDIPKADIGIVSHAPIPAITAGTTATIPSRNINLTSYAPEVAASENISATVPGRNLLLNSYQPAVVISSSVSVDVPKSNIKLTSYSPTISIAGSFIVAPERIYTYPAISRVYTYPKR